ncbi:MAG: FAD-dependent oxidoreductase [Rhizobiaceae bacterium]
MIVIVGAGIAGLSLAYALIQRGVNITVLDANTVASGASGVATSYLEPRLGETPMRKIERGSLELWPHFAAQLQEKSGLDVGYNTTGQLRVTTEEYLPQFIRESKARRKQGVEFQSLTLEEIQNREPALSTELVAGAFLPNVSWVNGGSICQALAVCIRNSGGEIMEGNAVTALKNRTLLMKDGHKIRAEKIIFCTGVGANSINGLPSDIPKSSPVRGVNLLLDMGVLKQPIRHLIKHHRGNLCPRNDGQFGQHLIVGTTYEADEASLHVADEVIEMLFQNAELIFPGVRELPLLGVKAGLRSKVGDGLLRLGRSRSEPNIYYSLSHAGAGFLRAPLIAEEFSSYILEGKNSGVDFLCGEFISA